ncbi:MAG: response regulator [Nitrospirae bacterium]|nr:response regulator [Nitrospirota bacterium]
MESARIQVVEDEGIIAMDLRSKLETLGYTVTSVVASGEDAIRNAERDKPDLVLMDIVLKGRVDGIAAARDVWYRLNIPVIYLTAYTEEKVLERAKATEPYGYLLKPCNDKELHVTLKMALYRHRMEQWRRRAEEAEMMREKEKLAMEQAKIVAMGEMLRAIAHNWRQPLNTIGLIVQDVEDAHKFGELNGEYIAGFIEKTMSELQLMSDIINNFRNFFKPEQEKTDFDLVQSVSDVCAFFGSQLKAHCIETQILDTTTASVIITGYANEFKQVVLNVLNNSMDAIVFRNKQTAVKGKITVSVHNENGKAALTITDNGGGIHESIMGRIFEPYFTTRPQGQGVGLGLYMSKLIIENSMNGEIGFKNVAEGASFTITLDHRP